MKKLVAIVLSLALIISLAACGGDEVTETSAPIETTTTPETEPPFDLSAYKALISGCAEQMSRNITLLSIVGLYEENLWDSLIQLSGTITPEKLSKKGFEYLEENTDYSEDHVHAWHSEIMDDYKAIISTRIDGGEAEAIKEVFEEYFDTYLSFYNLVISPSGDLSSFMDICDSYKATFENCETKLDILVS